MQLRFASVITLLAALAVSADLQINTPSNLEQCLPSLITWSDGTGPYFVVSMSVLPGGQPSASPLVDFGQQTGTSLTWTVNIASGTSIGFQVRDQTGAIANSAAVTVGSGGDSSCVGQSASVVAGSTTTAVTAGSATGSATASSGSASGSSGATTTAAGSTSRTSSSATSSGASSSSSSGAMPFAQIGSAGVIGALVAAIFA